MPGGMGGRQRERVGSNEDGLVHASDKRRLGVDGRGSAMAGKAAHNSHRGSIGAFGRRLAAETSVPHEMATRWPRPPLLSDVVQRLSRISMVFIAARQAKQPRLASPSNRCSPATLG